MTSFLIGQVLEPETRIVHTQKGDKARCTFAVLSGRSCTTFDVWGDDKCFDSASLVSDGDIVCLVVGDGLDKNGRLRHYLNNIAPCSQDIRDELNGLFKV